MAEPEAVTRKNRIDEKGLSFTAHDITGIEGIGNAKATSIAAAFEFMRRRIKPEGLKIKFPADVLPLIRHYANRKQEYLLSISVNGANEVINIRITGIGRISTGQIFPGEVFAEIISDRASAVIVARNQLHGEIEPGSEDKQMKIRLTKAAEILGLSFLDYIIFSKKGYYSFAENNDMQ